jgi:hypothetical protein
VLILSLETLPFHRTSAKSRRLMTIHLLPTAVSLSSHPSLDCQFSWSVSMDVDSQRSGKDRVTVSDSIALLYGSLRCYQIMSAQGSAQGWADSSSSKCARDEIRGKRIGFVRHGLHKAIESGTSLRTGSVAVTRSRTPEEKTARKDRDTPSLFVDCQFELSEKSRLRSSHLLAFSLVFD